MIILSICCPLHCVADTHISLSYRLVNVSTGLYVIADAGYSGELQQAVPQLDGLRLEPRDPGVLSPLQTRGRQGVVLSPGNKYVFFQVPNMYILSPGNIYIFLPGNRYIFQQVINISFRQVMTTYIHILTR